MKRENYEIELLKWDKEVSEFRAEIEKESRFYAFGFWISLILLIVAGIGTLIIIT